MSTSATTPNLIIATASFSATKKRTGAAAAFMAFMVNGKATATLKLAQPVKEPTNANRVALLAVLNVLGELTTKTGLTIEIRTPAAYIVKNVKNMQAWAANEWKTKAGKAVAHADLWKLLHGYMTTNQIVVVQTQAAPALVKDCKTVASSGQIIRDRKTFGDPQKKAQHKQQNAAKKQRQRNWNRRRREERKRIAAGDGGQRAAGDPPGTPA
jgi:ribonuclease HI